eukprot:TRINITY_DN2413_c0_g1_i2.p1 TRINITY_DN2413_c0_g1~~TRINITY_DN2413_c0_g1_i2.p1  ORF type:complete len:266 (-),score=52.19 TRINITY_DN2413_c0_g1_i2:56-853(-)
MYQNPYNQYGPNGQALFDLKEAQQHFEDFYEDLFVELCKFGEIEELNVCSNLGEHLLGNVYIKYYKEESAKKALEQVMGRFYAGRPLIAELSPVTDFREARCRQYDQGDCARGGFCNFMHLREVDRKKLRDLFNAQRKLYKKKRESEREDRGKKRPRSRSREREQSRSRELERSRSRERKRRRHRSRRERSRSKDRDEKKEKKGKKDRKEDRRDKKDRKGSKDGDVPKDGNTKKIKEETPEQSRSDKDVGSREDRQEQYDHVMES